MIMILLLISPSDYDQDQEHEQEWKSLHLLPIRHSPFGIPYIPIT
jgi:hypothetical protein